MHRDGATASRTSAGDDRVKPLPARPLRPQSQIKRPRYTVADEDPIRRAANGQQNDRPHADREHDTEFITDLSPQAEAWLPAMPPRFRRPLQGPRQVRSSASLRARPEARR